MPDHPERSPRQPSAPRPGGPAGPGPLALFGTLTGIAALTAVLVVGGAGLGLLADRALSAPHVFVFVGLLVGIVVAVLAVRSIVKRFFS